MVAEVLRHTAIPRGWIPIGRADFMPAVRIVCDASVIFFEYVRILRGTIFKVGPRPADIPLTESMEMFKGYELGRFYDEMFGTSGAVRDHGAPLLQKFGQLDERDFLTRKVNSELYFLRQGIAFNVYHDQQDTERIFPFDPIPRVMPAHEWEHLEAGLTQRIVALHLFLHDIYHDQQILKDDVIPRFYIEQAKHYRPEFRGVDVAVDTYIHICGSD
jgi:hypothetical protein